MGLKAKLKPLFLFLTFSDPAAAKNYCVENIGLLVALAAVLPTTILVLSGLFLLTLWIHPVLFVLAYIGLIYGLLQLGHLYDYHRGRAKNG